ncbi:restriction endonuclease subunit S, partial [Leuconostoc falkenbergense]|uniref:restriction endonuclease subunit S n=1 Tax=Leuconostoc falkenbergense TaxID=2766470 RepID=UPI0028A7E6A9
YKVDLLKQLKQAYLQKIFSQKLRFAGFSEDWAQRKLGEYVNFLNGRAYKQTELLDKGRYRVLRVGNFNTNDRWYYSDLELEQHKYANKGDLLYLWATNFGPEIWNEEKVIYHYHIWKLELLNNNLNKQYLYTWLMTDKERIKQNTNGTTMVHVTKRNMEQRDFQFPSIEEQIKVGSFFKQLDNLITLNQQKLNLLKKQKQAFLKKMFI